MRLGDEDLSGFWRDANLVSLAGQRATLRIARLRLLGAVVGAVGGAYAWSIGGLDLFALVAVLGFGVAFCSEVADWHLQPERDWYAGRAMAESAKTLCWRYAVGADPFPADLDPAAAQALLVQRFGEVVSKARDRVGISPDSHPVTAGMSALRSADFVTRREVYLRDRTLDQRTWYANRAAQNARNATRWRLALLGGEVLALSLAVGRIVGEWTVDLAGILGALVASGAAWVAQKQFTNLASAYRVASGELALQEERLRLASEQDWTALAADAEEAISREHTMWLASRLARRH